VNEFSTYKNWQKQAEIFENSFSKTKTISVVGALKPGFRSLAALKLVVNVVGSGIPRGCGWCGPHRVTLLEG